MIAPLLRWTLLFVLASTTVLAAAPGSPLRAGAAKIDITPATDAALSLLLINDIALAGVSGEVLTNISLRLKRESPFTRTLMVTHCNGSSGYLADDAAYDQVSYEITATRVKRGCAEQAIVNGFVQMMNEVF